MASTYLSRTPASAGNQKTFTWSGWVKRAKITDSQYMFCCLLGNQSRYSLIRFTATDEIGIFSGLYTTGSTTTQLMNLQTSAKYRDTSAWYHIVLSVDTTQATSTDRVKLYVNGNLETFDTGTGFHLLPTQNSDTFFNSTYTHRVGSFDGSIEFLNGSMSHVHWIDGTAYDASAFGETDATTGIWKPKTAPSVTYGTNGFFLKFENSANMDLDSSPNNLTFSTSGTLTQTVDTPSNVFATLNPLIPIGAEFSNGNLTHSVTSGGYQTALTTLGASSGKWYSEFKITTDTSYLGMGVVNFDKGNINAISYLGDSTNGVVLHPGANGLYYNATNPSFTTGTTFANGDIIGIALDIDNGFIYWHKNGTYMNSGVPTSGATGTGGFAVSNIANSDGTGTYAFGVTSSATPGTRTITCNFGNGYFGTTPVSSAGSNGNGAIFEYDVPTGYYALNTQNLATYG